MEIKLKLQYIRRDEERDDERGKTHTHTHQTIIQLTNKTTNKQCIQTHTQQSHKPNLKLIITMNFIYDSILNLKSV